MLLENLSKYNRPLEITFEEMLKLMRQCEHVDKLTFDARSTGKSVDVAATPTDATSNVALLASNIFPKSPLSILSGIIPGGCNHLTLIGRHTNLSTFH